MTTSVTTVQPRRAWRTDQRSAFSGMFEKSWLWAAVGLSLALHAAVLTVPLLQNAFSTVSLSGADWLRCAAVASSVLRLRELSKLIARRFASAR